MLRTFTFVACLGLMSASTFAQQPIQPANAAAAPAAQVTPAVPAAVAQPAPAIRRTVPPVAAPSASPSDQAVPQSSAAFFYMQEKERLDDPKQAIRRAAEFRASQRRRRIQSAKWFGYSKARPTTSHVPWMGSYGAKWVGNSYNPNHWRGTGSRTAVYVHPLVIGYRGFDVKVYEDLMQVYFPLE